MSGGNYECGGSAPKCCIELDPVTLTNDNSLVDTTCCPLAIPVENQEDYYCIKCKRHVLKYEVVLGIYRVGLWRICGLNS